MKRALTYYAPLIIAWIAAWLFYYFIGLDSQSSLVEFIYWTTAKFLIWILPIFVILSRPKKKTLDAIGLKNIKAGIRTGVIVGIVFIAASALFDVFLRSYHIPQLTIGFFSALLIAPLFEEIVFRGYILSAFEESGQKFWTANILAALMFLGLHLPGWYFMKSGNLTNLVLFASIFCIGLVAGYAKKKANSTWASIIFHFINNLYSSFLR